MCRGGVASIIETGGCGVSPVQRAEVGRNAGIRAWSEFPCALSPENDLKMRAFPHTPFVFLSFLLIGLPQNINPAPALGRCRSVSSCHFSIASSAARTRP